jgi:hypothetical protein
MKEEQWDGGICTTLLSILPTDAWTRWTDINEVRFCRNDPTIVLDSDAARKPDVVNVRSAVFDKDSRYDARLPRNEHKGNKEKNTRPDPSGHWPVSSSGTINVKHGKKNERKRAGQCRRPPKYLEGGQKM